jgi:hypothetical protein
MKRTHFWTVLLLAACSDARGEAPPERREQPDECADPAPRQLREVRRLAIDIAAQRACDSLAGRMMTIGGGEEGAPHEGRIWLRECRARARGDRLDLSFDAVVWAYADERTQTAGATFEVRQYVFLSASTTLRTVPEIDYDRRGHYAYLWLRPTEEPSVETRSIGPVDADPEGVWSHILGGFARIIGQRPDDQARQQVDEEGDRRLEEQVDRGFTIYTDLCTGEAGMEMGRLREPPFPRPRRGEAGPPTPVVVRPGGLDVHGPIADGREEMIVRMETTRGGPARARLLCKESAERLMEAFTSGEPMPEVEAIDDERVPSADARELRGGRREACPLYIATVPAGDAETTVAFTIRPARSRPEPLVPGCPGS